MPGRLYHSLPSSTDAQVLSDNQSCLRMDYDHYKRCREIYTSHCCIFSQMFDKNLNKTNPNFRMEERIIVRKDSLDNTKVIILICLQNVTHAYSLLSE